LYTDTAQGYYFAGSQEVSHIELAKAVGKHLQKHGVIENEEPISVSREQLDAILPVPRLPVLARYMFASNSRTRPDRAKKLFRYEPKAPTFSEAVEEDVLDAISVK